MKNTDYTNLKKSLFQWLIFVLIQVLIFISLVFGCSTVHAQTVVNGYAQVTAVSGSTFTVGAVNTSADDFQVGELIVMMQMQDNVIGSNTSHDAAFGQVATIGDAGNWEIVTITAISGTSTSPTSITTSSLTRTYNCGLNSLLQLVTFRSNFDLYVKKNKNQ